ncbi:unnamed protein product [Withania somnifera]
MEETIQHDKVDDIFYTTTMCPLNRNCITLETLWYGSYSKPSSLVNNWGFFHSNNFSSYDYKDQVSKAPFELLQFCVDNHCIFYEFDRYEYYYTKYPLSLWRLFHKRDKAREEAIFSEITNNCSVEKLAKKILGDEWNVNKPSTMEWWNPQHDWLLSDEKLKFGSLEAFLT